MIASCTFDNIICLILFGIVKTVSMAQASRAINDIEDSHIAWDIAVILIHNISGIAAGTLMGFIGWFFKYLEHSPTLCIYLKCAYCVICGIGFIVAS